VGQYNVNITENEPRDEETAKFFVKKGLKCVGGLIYISRNKEKAS
jgi:hypothetical protein